MILLLLRGLFIVMSAVVAALYTVSLAEGSAEFLMRDVVLTITVALSISALIVGVDWATPRKKLSALSGVLLGLLAGMTAAYAFSFLMDFFHLVFPNAPEELIQGAKVFAGVVFVYAAISLVLQTKDDFRFVLPYVEFAKQIRGNRPMLLDSSALIDGRIHDVAQTRMLQGLLVVPRFVLNELQGVADSADKLKRARGRRGLDIVSKLQSDPTVEVSIHDHDTEGATVDQKLIALAEELRGRIVTTDYNLAKIAEVRDVDVVNINSLAEALRPVVLPGEGLKVQIVKAGESAGQGVGYLEDGTMVVVEHARANIGREIALTVTSVLQTSAGRMIFGRAAEHAGDTNGDGSPAAVGSDHPEGGRGSGPSPRRPRRG
ncbi:MAG: PIN domain-containing protein [Phycisphaeraceae bacterium]